MKATRQFSRRKFIQLSASAIGVGATVSCGRLSSPWRSLTDQEARTLSSLCGQIIPEDDDPGAVSAGVVNYIDIQLASHFRAMRPIYRRGVAELNDRSMQRYGRSFPEISDQLQLDFLTSIERDQEWNGSFLRGFFRIVIDHTMQGFYGDPRHGGNRHRVSWAMLRLPYPPIRGRFRGETGAAGAALAT